jgi:hypothetical protein
MPAAIRTSNSTVAEARARRRDDQTQQILRELACDTKDGRKISTMDRISAVRQLVEHGKLETYEPLLPMLFTLRGKPYTLKNHFVFSPQFNCHLPAAAVWKTGRQVAKSTSISAGGILLANAVPHKTLLYICPLYEQIRRLSGNYVRAFIDQSPVRDLWTGTTTENSVLQRSFKNNSKMIFSFALLDADRIRGIAADLVSIDEIQDMDSDHLPIIRETMAVSEWKLQRFTGTPKTLDNTIEGLWRDSSMAEWFVPCWACGKMNIPSLEFDLERMLGPLRDDITPYNPATICANPQCGRPINPRYGRWVHRESVRRWDFAGHHIPQILLPMHYGDYRAWSELLGKQRGAANTSPHVFINEVLGESSATGNQLLTLDDIRRAAVLPWSNQPNDPDATMWDWLDDYPIRVLAVDWGGGGQRKNTGMAKSGAKLELTSYTTLALLGMRSDGQIHVLWGKRLLTPHEHAKEAAEVWYWCQRFRPRVVAHDYTGAGTVRETILVQAGMPVSLIMPIAYVRSASASLIQYIQATPSHQRDHYNLDKTRSLLYMTSAVKLGVVKFFRDDYLDKENPGLLRDLIALVDEKIESAHARDIYLIRKADGFTDDFAQSVNMGCAALWHMTQWPNFAQLADLPMAQPLDQDQINIAGNAFTEWSAEDLMEGGFLSPS